MPRGGGWLVQALYALRVSCPRSSGWDARSDPKGAIMHVGAVGEL
jgi:hypothetical protein